jgi:Na+/H+ antiporter NhaA
MMEYHRISQNLTTSQRFHFQPLTEVSVAGIRFTMSLFLGRLAFTSSGRQQHAAKCGVLDGALFSALTSVILLRNR